jgi:hypothetical protein
MSLVRIPGSSAFDIGTFACACHHIRAAAVETDPMRSAAALWLASHDLRPILRRQIDLAKDDVRRQWLMIRLAEEEAKGRVATR